MTAHSAACNGDCATSGKNGKQMPMKNRSSTRFAFLAATLTLGMHAQPLSAAVIFHDTLASFQAASTTNVAATFEAFTPTETNIFIPPQPPISEGGVIFTPRDTSSPREPNLVVAIPGGGAESTFFHVKLESNVLTVSGNENIDLTFSTATTAVGFDTYTNPYDAAVVTVYDTAGKVIGTHALSQPPDTRGFFGITSDVPIGKVNWLAERGGTINTAIDNVRVGNIRPHVVRFYLRGPGAVNGPITGGWPKGLIMATDPAQDPREGDGLANPDSWFSEPPLTGTFETGATFIVRIPGASGLNLAMTYRLAATNPDGSGEQMLGQVTQVLGTGTQTITIPVKTPLTLAGERLKLTISAVGLTNMTLDLGGSSYVEATNFVGTP